MSSYGDVFDNAYQNIKDKNVCGEPCGDNTQYHYYIRIPNKGAINAGGCCPSGFATTVISGLTSIDIEWIYNTGSWNNEYDISNNEMIIAKINSIFKSYEKV